MDIQRFRAEFPITRSKIFLNHAAVSPLPLRSADAMRSYVENKVKAQLTHDVDLGDWRKKIAETKGLFARLIGAREDEIAHIPNTTFGLNLIAQMLDYKPGSNVVTNTLEYISNVIVWLKLRERGVEVRIVRDVGGRISVDMLEKSIDDRTVVVAVGQVGWYNGFRHDLRAISEIAHERGAFLAVDGIQAVGNMKIDVAREGIDFLACGSYKWLLGPLGAGFLYIKSEHIDRFNPPILGGGSIDPEVSRRNIYERFDLYELKYSKGIGKYEAAHINDVAYIGVGESMRLLLDYGVENVEERIKRIGDYFISSLIEMGYELQTPLGEDEHHAIINFKVKDPDAVMDYLSRNGVVVSKRVGGIRVSPHFYNTEEEIEKFLSILKGIR
ncbi:MAG: aminotransferase class V-fold PLP-dependent enzyme [Candidatus Bathyarchaeia archaeon]